MKRHLIIILLLGVLALSASCSAPPVSQSEEPQDGQYYSLEYVLSKSKAEVYFYGTRTPTNLYAIEITYTSGGILSVKRYFTFTAMNPRRIGTPYLYTDELRIFGGNWEVRELE